MALGNKYVSKGACINLRHKGAGELFCVFIQHRARGGIGFNAAHEVQGNGAGRQRCVL